MASKTRVVVCGICADDLCENHEQDCTFRALGWACACPNRAHREATRMAEVKQPTDHKQKATPFTFTGADDETYTLPLASTGVEAMPGQYLYDATMKTDDEAELRLGFAMLDACGAEPEARTAILALPMVKMQKVFADWFTHGDGDGASVPQS